MSIAKKYAGQILTMRDICSHDAEIFIQQAIDEAVKAERMRLKIRLLAAIDETEEK